MFHIEFIDDKPEPQEEGGLSLWGRVTFGDYHERFLAPLGPWGREDYERQWLEAARRLLDGADRTGFFTQPYWMWWTMWREGEQIFVHEELITPERFSGPYDGKVPYHLIEDRVTHTEDGDPISEWRITLDDVRSFVERKMRTSVPA